MERQDVVDAAKAGVVAVFNGGWMLHIEWSQIVSFLGGAFTVYVALEKFYKVAQAAARKLKSLHRPPEG